MVRTLTFMAIVPAALVAQSKPGATPTTVEAEITAAREWRLPVGPIYRRVEEARARGATEAQLAIAAHKVRLNMEGALSAMVSGGRFKPSEDEIDTGGAAMERGYTREQIRAVVKSVPPDSSLVAAFDALTRLNDRGVPAGKAVAQVQARIASRNCC